MNTPQLPSVELIQGAQSPEPTGPARWRRWKVFFSVLLIGTAIGLAIVYGRSPVYRAAASVLTVKPKAVDTRSAQADVEHVAIQGRLLLGEELLGRLSQRLVEEGDGDMAGLDRLRGSLAVVAVPDTNLLELRADGADPEQLQRVVNRWAESYEGFRAEEIEAATGRTTAEIEDQQVQLEGKIEKARADMLAFREANDIVSLERGENRSLSKLKGLNDSLNKARERLVEAEARTMAVDQAIALGETVIPSEQKSDIAKMQLQLQRYRIRWADLQQKYTQQYIDRDLKLKRIPDEIREMEQELAQALSLAKITVRDEAQQALEAAKLSVATLEQKLADHQQQVQQFTERFKEYKALEGDLDRLERLKADNEERLAKIQVGNLKKYPPIQIVEWARLPTRPIYPDYERDLMIALGAALALALFVTWLVEYLSERSRPTQTQPYLGVRIYTGEQPQALNAPHMDNRLDYQQATPRLDDHPPANLPILPRELAGAEVKSLLAVSDPAASGYATLLLSGVSPYELPLLHAACFDPSSGQIEVPGASRRVVEVGQSVWRRLEAVVADMDGARMALPVADLDARLSRAAQDAQLADPGSVNALALWHTYVVYLVRQGIDASALARRVGSVPQGVMGTLMHYAPPGGNRPLSSIDFTHPALAF
ncbi:MAG: hypothetical protein LJE59_12170 [Chromatiaceae bacterium]|nr:hypothetical protein [Chromatiaceae bacterium]